MDRRQAVKNVAFLIGGALSATTLATILEGCSNPTNSANALIFNKDELNLITDIADVIIPTTASSPGAREAGVGPFIPMMIADCFPAEVGPIFKDGLKDVETRSAKNFSKKFGELTNEQKIAIIEEVRLKTIEEQGVEREERKVLDEKAKLKAAAEPKIPGSSVGVKDKPKGKSYFFVIMRDLTILGFSTSEIGATQAYSYLPIPGRYDGCVDLKPGQKLWS